MLERIISRGVYGPERTALEAAEIFGLMTGGQSRHGSTSAGEARRFGLAVDHCSRRHAIQINADRADGTLVIGRPSRLLLRELERQCRVFEMQMDFPDTAKWICEWIERFDIRTLNILGCAWSGDTFPAERSGHLGQLIVDILVRLGRRPRLPVGSGCGVVAGRDGIYAVRLWRTPRAWLWRGRLGWKPVRRNGWLVEMKFTCGNEWYKPLLPQNVLLAMSPGGVELDCSMLTLLSRLGETALDLARAGRWAVLRMLASPSTFAGRRISRHGVRRLATAKQRNLLAVFGFPATESAVRTLAKVSQTVPDEMLLQLRDRLHDPATAGVLRHLPGINELTIEALSDPIFRRWITPAFLDDLANPNGYGASLNLPTFHDRMRRLGIEPRPDSIRSVAEMFDLFLDPRLSVVAPAVPPPPAPRRLRGVIVQLKPAQLEMEGYQMRHCVNRYRAEVEAGACLIYRILPDAKLGTDRATLMLRPTESGGEWIVSQLAGVENERVSSATQLLVKVWLKYAGNEPTISTKDLFDRCMMDIGIEVVEVAA